MDLEKNGYRLVWNDEFDGDTLDMDKWTLRPDMGSNAQTSLAGLERPDVLSVSDSLLQMNAVEDGALPDGRKHYTVCYSVTTFNKMHFQYGYVEIRAKVPYMQGAWPSFWMKSVSGDISPRYVWDYRVEVDVFEVFSSPNKAVPNIHKWYEDKRHTQMASYQKKFYAFENYENLSEEFHIYGFQWTPEEMSMWIDGNKYATYDLSYDFDGGGDMKGFHDPLYILFNNYIFTPSCYFKPEGCLVDERTRFPINYSVDWIRLYQREGEGALYLPKGV